MLPRLGIVAALAVVGVGALGCGEGPSGAPAVAVAVAVPTPAPAPAEDADFARARDVMQVYASVAGRGGGYKDSARRGFGMYPERSRRGLVLVIERKTRGWTEAFEFLAGLAPDPTGATGEALLRIWRSEPHREERSRTAAALGAYGVGQAGPEILAELKSVDPKETYRLGRLARGMALAAPAEVLPFALQVLATRPLPPGEAAGPLAEAVGRADAAKALEVLPPLLDAAWDEAGLAGVLRGLGATGRPEAERALMAFVEKVYALRDARDLAGFRRFGEAFFVALGELARFDTETSRRMVLAHDYPFTNTTEDARQRVHAAAQRVTLAERVKNVAAWSAWPGSGGLAKRIRMLAEEVMRDSLDPGVRAGLLADVRKLRGNSEADANVRDDLIKLGPWARAGDAEVLALLRELGARRGVAWFTSRAGALQELGRARDPQLPAIVTGLGGFGRMSDWGRVDWELKEPVPGLSDAFLKAELRLGQNGDGVTRRVFEALALESRPDVLAWLQKHVEADLESPLDSLLTTWLTGLSTWRDPKVVPYLRDVIGRIEAKGVKVGTREPFDRVKQALGDALHAAYAALAAQGLADGLRAVYDLELETLPNVHTPGVPRALRPYVDQDFGPFKADWPPLAKLLERAKG